jgi:hypothetical protein
MYKIFPKLGYYLNLGMKETLKYISWVIVIYEDFQG